MSTAQRSATTVILFVWLVFLCLLAPGCTLVDQSFASRVDSINGGYDSAMRAEVLTNIVRASQHAPLRFYLHSKIVPSQTSDVKVGLPTITLGPGQAAAAKQFIFASNGTDNSATLSLEVDPLETRDFHNSLATPVPIATIGLMLQNFPRELVLLALLDSFRVETPEQGPIIYRNMPEVEEGCREYHYDGILGDNIYDPAYAVDSRQSDYQGIPFDDHARNPYKPPGEGNLADLHRCSYRRFQYWLAMALAYGLTVDFGEVPNPKHNAKDPKDTTPAIIVSGRFCFDPALAQRSLVPLVKQFKDLCPSAMPSGASTKPATVSGVAQPFPLYFTGPNHRTIRASVSIQQRSLLNVYRFLGTLLKLPADHEDLVRLYTREGRIAGGDKLLNIRQNTVHCSISVSMDATSYCVPAYGGDTTLSLFAMLTELTSLMQSATDVPNSLSVRLTP